MARPLHAREGDDVVEVAIGVAGNAEHEAAIDHRLHDRRLLEICAVGGARRDPERLQLLGEIVLRLLASRRRRRAALEFIGANRLDVVRQRLSGDLIFGGSRRWRRRLGRRAPGNDHECQQYGPQKAQRTQKNARSHPTSLSRLQRSHQGSRLVLRNSSTSRATLLITPVCVGFHPSARAFGLRTF